MPARLLRGHVADGPHDGAFLRLRRFDRAGVAFEGHVLGEAEIEDLHEPVAGDHHVLGFQVPVDDAGFVSAGEPARDLASDLEQTPVGKRPRERRFAERPAFDELHRDVGDRALLAHLVYGHDVRVVQGRSGAGLPLEATNLDGVRRDCLGQDFQGHVPQQSRVPRPVHLSHPARAELPENLVAAEPAAAPRRGAAFPAHRLCTDSVETPAA